MTNYNIGDFVRIPNGKIERVTAVGDGIAYACGCWANRELQPVPPFRVGDRVQITGGNCANRGRVGHIEGWDTYEDLPKAIIRSGPGHVCHHPVCDLTPVVEESKVDKPAERPVVVPYKKLETEMNLAEIRKMPQTHNNFHESVFRAYHVAHKLRDLVVMDTPASVIIEMFDDLMDAPDTYPNAIKSALAGEGNND